MTHYMATFFPRFNTLNIQLVKNIYILTTIFFFFFYKIKSVNKLENIKVLVTLKTITRKLYIPCNKIINLRKIKVI